MKLHISFTHKPMYRSEVCGWVGGGLEFARQLQIKDNQVREQRMGREWMKGGNIETELNMN